MSHLHFPDGLLPLWLIIVGFILTILILSYCLKKLKEEEEYVKKISLLAIMSALMLVTMSIPLGFLHYHVNLTVLVSLILGPWLAFIGVFIVNLFLGGIGHGGITVVGLNTLVVGSEVFLAYFFFSHLRKYLKPYASIFSTVIISLLISSLLMVATAVLAGISPTYLEDSHAVAGGVAIPTIGGYLAAFATYILPILLVGVIIEAAVTVGVIKYIKKVKADLVNSLFESKNSQTGEKM